MTTARTFFSELVHIGPHNRSHLPAFRAAVAVGLPLLVLIGIGHPEWTAFAAFGAFASIYGRDVPRRTRLRMQVEVGLALAWAVTLGTATSTLPHTQWLIVIGGAVVAAVAGGAADLLTWRPGGGLFCLFGFAVCASSTTATGSTIPASGAISLLATVLAILVSLIDHRSAEHQRRPRIDLVAHVRAPEARRHLARNLIAPFAAGAIATAVGIGHPYWAMVGAIVPMSAPDTAARLLRGVHRVVGTLCGLLVAGAMLSFHPGAIWIVVLIIVTQVGAELFVARNYSIALLFITPLALLMGQLVHPLPVGRLMFERGVETIIGVAVGFVLVWLTHIEDKA